MSAKWGFFGGMVMRLTAWTGFVVVCAMSVGAAIADTSPTPPVQPAPDQTPAQPPPPPPTYGSLMSQGFEVKNVMLMTDAISTRLASITQPETVLVTLEKGPVTATCWITLSGWQTQNISNLPCSLLK